IRPPVSPGSTEQRARRAPVPLGEVETWTLPNAWRSRSQKAKKALSFQTGSSRPAASAWIGSDNGPQSAIAVRELMLSVIWFSFGSARTAGNRYDADRRSAACVYRFEHELKFAIKLIPLTSRSCKRRKADGWP